MSNWTKRLNRRKNKGLRWIRIMVTGGKRSIRIIRTKRSNRRKKIENKNDKMKELGNERIM